MVAGASAFEEEVEEVREDEAVAEEASAVAGAGEDGENSTIVRSRIFMTLLPWRLRQAKIFSSLRYPLAS